MSTTNPYLALPIQGLLPRPEPQASGGLHSMSLRQRSPFLSGIDCYGECEPAGGTVRDLFDLIPLEGRMVIAAVGEVTRNDEPSGIVQAGIQASLRRLVGEFRADLPRVIKELNRMLCELSAESVLGTLFCARLDPARGQLHYVNAGHEPALLFGARNGRIHRLEATGTLLGLSPRSKHGSRAVPAGPGDLLAGFTDGVSESEDRQGRHFREVGVIEVIRRYPDASAQDLAAEILAAANRFSGGTGGSGDRTVVVVRLARNQEQPAARKHASELELSVA